VSAAALDPNLELSDCACQSGSIRVVEGYPNEGKRSRWLMGCGILGEDLPRQFSGAGYKRV